MLKQISTKGVGTVFLQIHSNDFLPVLFGFAGARSFRLLYINLPRYIPGSRLQKCQSPPSPAVIFNPRRPRLSHMSFAEGKRVTLSLGIAKGKSNFLGA